MKQLFLLLFACIGLLGDSFAQPGPVANFSGNPTTVCQGRAVTWTNLTTGGGPNSTYAWSFPGTNNPTSTVQSPAPRTYTAVGTFNVTLIVTDPGGNDTMVKTNYITVVASPTVTVAPSTGFICSVGSVTLTASGASTYTWAPAGSLNTNTGSVVVASPSFSTNYTVVGTNSSGCTAQTTVPVSVNNAPPAAPTQVTGPQNVCNGQTASYTVPGINPPTPMRNWTVPAGATIISGQGTRSITVTFGSISGNVCCTQSNACGTSAPTCLSVTVNPTPAVGTVGSITGPTAVCANQNGISYSISPVANAATYSWTIGGGGGTTIVSGQGTDTITVDFGTNNNNICVTASNSCNTSPVSCRSVTVSGAAPGIPGTINGPTTVCNGQSANYTVGFVTGALSYTWSAPSGAVVASGQGTRTVTIAFGSTTGSVCVTATNGCGTSQGSCKTVTVDPNPAVDTVGVITGPTAVCDNQSGVIYSVAPVSGATSYTWTVPGGSTITAGQGTGTITVTIGTNGGNVCCRAENSCSISPQRCISITASPNPPGIPGAITGSSTVCSGQAGVNYSVAAVAGALTYSWTVPSGATITNGAGTRSITVTFGTQSGTVCVTASNGCGTSAATCKTITVDPNQAVDTVGAITGPTAVCANLSGVTYSVAPVNGATTYSWTVPNGASITAGQGTSTITVTYSVSPGQVCVTASNSCSTSPQRCISVTMSPNPPGIPGAITGPSTVCNGAGPVNYSVGFVTGATTYSWTVPGGTNITSGQGTRTITVTFGASSGSVCVTAGNACGNSSSSCKTITVDPNPAVDTVGVITGPTAVCANQSGINYSVAPVTGATTYSWTVPAGANITAGQGTSTITVTFGGNPGNVCVTASNSCSSTPQKCMALTMSPTPPGIPGAITGPTTVCNGEAGVNYSVGNVTNATSYNWTVPGGANITAGQGTRTITVTFGATSGSVCITASNACGTSSATCKTITVDPNPAVDTVGVISGPSGVCANQSNVVYSVAPVTGATTYSWTVPAGASITGGQGTGTITVTFAVAGGNVCVTASNSCSTSPQKCLAVGISAAAPAIPGVITGPTTVCNGQTGVDYSVATVVGATTYSWTIPATASITAGQGTNTITVSFGSGSGTVCVTAGNACGTSLASCLTVTVDPNPALGTPGAVSGTSAVCANQSSVTYSVPAMAGATTYSWTVPTGASITGGQGTNTITVTFGNVSGNVCVEASNSCSTSPQSCLAVSVSPAAPGIPGAITGPMNVCNAQSGTQYSITPVANATTYAWTVPSGATITAGQGTSTITVTFGASSGTICVTASNACGTSLGSCKSVTVSPTALNVSVGSSPASCSSCCDGSATATPSGGTAPYTYSWNSSPAQTTAMATGLCAGMTYTVCVTDGFGCITCDTVTIPFTTGVPALTDNGSIRVFPNPANDFLTIEGSISVSAVLQVNVVSVYGQKVMDKAVFANGYFSEKLNIAGIPSGVYFIEVRSGELIRELKFIKVQ